MFSRFKFKGWTFFLQYIFYQFLLWLALTVILRRMQITSICKFIIKLFYIIDYNFLVTECSYIDFILKPNISLLKFHLFFATFFGYCFIKIFVWWCAKNVSQAAYLCIRKYAWWHALVMETLMMFLNNTFNLPIELWQWNSIIYYLNVRQFIKNLGKKYLFDCSICWLPSPFRHHSHH